MASHRKTPTGKWELTVRHPQLPKGRKYFTFDTEDEAVRYGEQWDLLVKSGIPIPHELLEPPTRHTPLGAVLRGFANSGKPSPTDQVLITRLMAEVGSVPLTDLTYRWVEEWVERLKTVRNLAPSSIRQRVGALARAVDHHQRGKGPDVAMLGNPLRLLPVGYATYNERDRALVLAAGKEAKEDEVRNRRLTPGEHERILAALHGDKRADRERALALPEGNAMQVLYLVIRHTGMRLKEAYTLEAKEVDLNRKVIRVRTSKQWRGKLKHRDVPILPELYEVLKDFKPAGELLFPFKGKDEAERTVTSRLSARFATVFRYAACEDLTEHDLRHEATCAWFELRARTGHWIFRPEEINRIMGWAPGSNMGARYASFRGEDLAARLYS